MDCSWSFAKVNNKLAEIFFERRKRRLIFYGHCYVKRSDYKTKNEEKWIDSDIQKHDFIFRNSEYIDRKTGEKFKLVSLKNKH